ncbi:hypothetical protein [Chitinophaga niabensis]|uniref:Uncharacterized protein n=1 Tax=Chitinophaga niabensis TaxID=536979 RepID=A0A1N6E3G9_9BACT|nr:hypothetical protein [Chitinophaga niabensis]SIN77517.1 hypothetical protein SAMN04488055_1272 [Chitinophaga niabensis]
MKNKFLGLAVLAIAAVAAFAFKAPVQKTFAFQTFELVSGGSQLNPLDYVVSTSPSCTGLAQVCTIDALNAGEIYTSSESLARFGNTLYTGKPKIDDATNYSFQSDISAAIADNSSSTITLPNGRVIEKKP